MKYMIFIIYVIVIGQFINSKPIGKKNSVRRGHLFYKTSALINFIIGFIGIFIVNTFLRGKEIIPQFFVWIALIGFLIMIIYAMYCIYKMLVSTEL